MLDVWLVRLGVGHAVHFAGSVKSGTTHLKALFKSCDAVIVPSRNEPFGIVVLEARGIGIRRRMDILDIYVHRWIWSSVYIYINVKQK